MIKEKTEKKILLSSLLMPTILLVIMWSVKILETVFDTSFAFLGIYPHEWHGLPGIILAPFIHSNFSHLSANSVPLFILMATLFYFYRKIAMKIFILIFLFTNIWVWISAREAFHIGASGVVYGLASFLFISGLIRKNPRLMAISLMVAFLYGSLIWGLFPELFPEENISWESHLWGLVAGAALALYYRNQGPQRKLYSWDYEEEKEDEDDESTYWKTTTKS